MTRKTAKTFSVEQKENAKKTLTKQKDPHITASLLNKVQKTNVLILESTKSKISITKQITITKIPNHR